VDSWEALAPVGSLLEMLLLLLPPSGTINVSNLLNVTGKLARLPWGRGLLMLMGQRGSARPQVPVADVQEGQQ